MHIAEVPVLLVIFNRPEKVQRLVEALVHVKPKRLYIYADGPRVSKAGEVELCRQTREQLSHIDWECDVLTCFKDENLGTRYAMVEAIDWLFEHEETGIILEDDCVPHPSFFSYCEELLAYYRNDDRIMCVSGNNFQDGIQRGDGSYYFSLYPHCWGWATWRWAWQEFRPAVENMDSYIKQKRIQETKLPRAAQRFWVKEFKTKAHWASLWVYTLWYNNGLSILPNVNLVSNVGFDVDATNTKEVNEFSNIPTHNIGNIRHPRLIEADKSADEYTYYRMWHRSILKRIIEKVISMVKNSTIN